MVRQSSGRVARESMALISMGADLYAKQSQRTWQCTVNNPSKARQISPRLNLLIRAIARNAGGTTYSWWVCKV